MPRPTFQIPTADQLRAYAAEIGYSTFIPDRFLNHWEMRGWEVKKGIRMKCWKAAVRTWRDNDYTYQAKTNKHAAGVAAAREDERQIAEYIRQIQDIRSWKGHESECPYGDPKENYERLIEKIRNNHARQFMAKLMARLKGTSV